MTTPRKNPAAVALGRLGGQARSEAKTIANRIKAQNRWAKVRAAKALAAIPPA